jgi:hypothetical protein
MIKKELIGSKITKGHHTVIVEQTKQCESICKALKLDVFEKVPTTKTKTENDKLITKSE